MIQKTKSPIKIEDATTTTGIRVLKHCNDRLVVLRKTNDGDLDSEKTAVIRGRIRELKRLQAQFSADPTGAVDES